MAFGFKMRIANQVRFHIANSPDFDAPGNLSDFSSFLNDRIETPFWCNVTPI